MSRMFHRYQQNEMYPLNLRNVEIPAIYNTYSSIRREQVTEGNVLALIPRAAKVGIELFVIDAGWQAAMGDWVCDPVKFPNGLGKIIESVHAHGMKFGLWLEFERIDKGCPVFQKHPE